MKKLKAGLYVYCKSKEDEEKQMIIFVKEDMSAYQVRLGRHMVIGSGLKEEYYLNNTYAESQAGEIIDIKKEIEKALNSNDISYEGFEYSFLRKHYNITEKIGDKYKIMGENITIQWDNNELKYNIGDSFELHQSEF